MWWGLIRDSKIPVQGGPIWILRDLGGKVGQVRCDPYGSQGIFVGRWDGVGVSCCVLWGPKRYWLEGGAERQRGSVCGS